MLRNRSDWRLDRAHEQITSTKRLELDDGLHKTLVMPQSVVVPVLSATHGDGHGNEVCQSRFSGNQARGL